MKKLYKMIDKFAEYLEEYEPFFDQYDKTLPEPKDEDYLTKAKETRKIIPFMIGKSNKVSLQ